MTTINLLPWREELREERKREFLVTLASVVVVAGLILLLVDRYYNSEIKIQNQRNSYLSEQITLVDSQIAEIQELQKKKDELTERMAVIQDLQGTRPVIVRLFDQLVRNMPEGVYFTNISRTGEQIKLDGVAESNARVSTLMTDLGSSDWFSDPILNLISTDDTTVENSSQKLFTLTVPIIRPEQSTEQGGAQ